VSKLGLINKLLRPLTGYVLVFKIETATGKRLAWYFDKAHKHPLIKHVEIEETP
jgi:hypothetical protein